MNDLQKKKDLEFGEKSEKLNINILSNFFNCNLVNTEGNRNPFDFVDEEKKVFIELKSRRNTKDKYADTMVGTNKINTGFKHINNEYKVYFCFQFTDGLYYYQLDEKTYKKTWERAGGRRDRGRFEINQYSYIPTNILNLIKTNF